MSLKVPCQLRKSHKTTMKKEDLKVKIKKMNSELFSFILYFVLVKFWARQLDLSFLLKRTSVANTMVNNVGDQL